MKKKLVIFLHQNFFTKMIGKFIKLKNIKKSLMFIFLNLVKLLILDLKKFLKIEKKII